VVPFAAPSGRCVTVDGFWDGGDVWRARVMPDEVGRWTYRTTCSDVANSGLHGRAGAFECTPAPDRTPFDRHGPVRVAANRRSFEHACWHSLRDDSRQEAATSITPGEEDWLPVLGRGGTQLRGT